MQVNGNLDSSQPRREIPTHEASRISGLSPTHIAYLLRKGKLEGRRFGNRMWMVYVDSLENYLATPRKPGPSVKEIREGINKPSNRPELLEKSVTQPAQIYYVTELEGRLVVGYQYGEKLHTGTPSNNLYALASLNARWLMRLTGVEHFAVDDCIVLTHSNNFEGWEPQDVETTILSTQLPIPDDLEQLRLKKLPEVQKSFANSSHYRLASFTPSFTTRERLEVTLAPLNFYDYYSLTPFLDESLLTAPDGSKISPRQKYGNTALTYSSAARQASLIPAPVNIQGIIVTKNQQIVLMRRSLSVALYPNHWSASFEETMNAPGFNRRGKPQAADTDFFACTIRGLEDEFAIPASVIESMKILSLNVEYLVLAVGVITVIKVNLNAEEIKQNWMIKARDADEASKFAVVPTDLSSVVDKLFSKILWHPTSRMRLIQFLFHTYGVDEVAKAIQARGI